MSERGKDGDWRIRRRTSDPETFVRWCERIESDVRDGLRLPPPDSLIESMRDSMLRDADRPTQAMMRALQARARACGLSRADRLSLAETLLRRDVESWSSLSYGEARQLLTAMEGFALIAHLQAEQGRVWRYGRCPAESCPMRSSTASAAALLDPDS